MMCLYSMFIFIFVHGYTVYRLHCISFTGTINIITITKCRPYIPNQYISPVVLYKPIKNAYMYERT